MGYKNTIYIISRLDIDGWNYRSHWFFSTILVPSAQPEPELLTEPKSTYWQDSPVNTTLCLFLLLFRVFRSRLFLLFIFCLFFVFLFLFFFLLLCAFLLLFLILLLLLLFFLPVLLFIFTFEFSMAAFSNEFSLKLLSTLVSCCCKY